MRCALVNAFAMLALASCARADAESFDCHKAAQPAYDACVARVKVPKNNECCQPPPCAYQYQLAMYQMLQAMFGSSKLQQQAKDGAALEKLVKHLAEGKTFQAKLPNCPSQESFHGSSIAFPPSFATGQEKDSQIGGPDKIKCVIGFYRPAVGSGEPPFVRTNRDTAGQWFQTCNELIDVNMSHEEVHKAACQEVSDAGDKYDLRDPAEVGNEEVKAYQVSIKKMTDLLDGWGLGCSTEKLKNGAQQRAAAGIKALGLGGGGKGKH